MRLAIVVFLTVAIPAAGGFFALAQSGSRNVPPPRQAEPAAPQTEDSGDPQRQTIPLGLAGYCPVSIRDGKRWLKGTPAHKVFRDGLAYHLAGEREKQRFLADPAKYVPVLNGDCVIHYAGTGRRVAGDIRFAMFHQGRLFLFTNKKAKQAFAADPQALADVDLAYGGNCPVSRLDLKQAVPGKPELTVFHDGLRYHFPSAKQQDLFLARPARYKVGASGKQVAVGGSDPEMPDGEDSDDEDDEKGKTPAK
ncbi:MAG: hypothetical protein ACYTG0_10065 [Planctomycetota bacterium]|jgi:YHS domain-containing protein